MDNKLFSRRFLSVPGPSSGFQVLLNVHSEEYCLRGLQDHGIGFRVLVHDANSVASFNLDPSFALSPGYEYTVSLRPITYDLRNFSEWLGKCTMDAYNILNPNLTEYNRELCFMTCLVELVWQLCDCLIVDKSSNILQSRSVASHLGTETSKLRYCDITQSKDHNCAFAVYVQYLTLNQDQYCPKCKRKCLETKYEFEVTAKKLKKQTLNTLLPKSMMSNVSLQKNLIFVSFMFDDTNSQTVQEIQAFTSLQLYIYIGGALALFLGSSTITIYEVAHHLFITLSILVSSCCRKQKQEKANVLF